MFIVGGEREREGGGERERERGRERGGEREREEGVGEVEHSHRRVTERRSE